MSGYGHEFVLNQLSPIRRWTADLRNRHPDKLMGDVMVIIVPREPTALKRNFHPSLPQLHISKVRECRITAWFVTRDTKWRTAKSSKEMDVNQRAQRAKERRLCFRCLNSSKHRARQCNEKGRCGVENCPKYHHPLIHGAAPFFVEAAAVGCGSSTALLQIVLLVMQTPQRNNVHTYVLLVSGSHTSLIIESFVDEVGLEARRRCGSLVPLTPTKNPNCPETSRLLWERQVTITTGRSSLSLSHDHISSAVTFYRV